MTAHLRLFLLTLVFATVIGAGQYIRHIQVHDLETLSVSQNTELAKAFANTMYARIEPLLSRDGMLDPHELRNRPEVKTLDAALMVALKRLNVSKLKVYDLDGMTVFSTQLDQIGEAEEDNPGFLGAMRGETTGSIVRRGTFNAFDKLIEERSLVQAYVPIRQLQTDEIRGVLEVYADITPLLEWINTSQNRVQWATLTALVIGYAILIFVFRRMDQIRSNMRGEVTSLAEELDRNRLALEDRVVERTRELRASGAFLESVIDSVPDPLWLIDTDFRIRPMNRAANAWISKGGNKKCNTHCYEVLHDRELPCEEAGAPCLLRRVIATDHLQSLIHTDYGRDGEPRVLEVQAVPLRDVEGQPIGMLKQMHDVTAREKAQRKLAREKQTAETSLEASSRCMSNITHELRTPMNAVIGMIDVLKRTPLTAQQRQYLQIMANSGHALAGLFEDLLGWSKYESGEGEMRRDELDLRLVVDTVLDILAHRAGQKGLDLLTFVEPDVPARLLGDFGAVRQILLNLMGNALKFTNEGFVLLRVGLAEPGVDRCRLRVQVSDSGMGIPVDLIPKIFQRFKQGSTAVRFPETGAGLGLSICRTLVERMDGTIGFQPHPDRGTTFWFEIWLDVPPDSGSESPMPEFDLEGARVLVVSGGETSRAILQEQVGAIGGRCEAVENAVDCLKALYDAEDSEDPYRLVVIDTGLAEVSGKDLAQAIKVDPALCTVCVLVLRPFTDPIPAQDQSEIGFEAQFPKPLKQIEFAEVLLGLVEDATGSAAPTNGDTSVPEATPHATETNVPVLLVDDNPVNRHVVQLLVDHLGCQAECADSGERALELLEAKNYGLVLMDCQMPGMDGIVTTSEIRRREKLGSITPVVAMTAVIEPEDHRRCLLAGMDDILLKPVTEANLAEMLKRWLAVGRQDLDDPVWAVLNPSLWARLRKASEQQPDFAAQLADMFVKHTEASLAGVRSYLEAGDNEQLARAAHGLFGACAQIGADRLQAIARSLEQNAANERLAAILVERLEREFESVREALSSICTASGEGVSPNKGEASLNAGRTTPSHSKLHPA